ncbi:unnamed protein product [Tetraodon nigroviridis]|uniref:(spotted green pufferfish) hypothetical protein n=1 Tax=Tetraodon nigroviridis TaxID=99883 RepID=Q4SAZ6_TETNG|nr:unnamed protein product [Tetraodon nigroviridis]
MSKEISDVTTYSQTMSLFDSCAVDPPTLEEEPKCTAGNDVNELYWNICNEIDTKPQNPSQFSHHDMGETLLPSLDLSDFGDISADLKQCWKHLDTVPLENSEVLEAQFPANLPPLPLHSTPHPSNPPQTPNKSVPQPPTSVPPPTSPSSHKSPSPPGSSQTVQICPKLNVIVRSLKKEEPVKEAKTKKKGPRCKKQIDQVPTSTVPSTQNKQMHFVGWLNGQQLYKIQEEDQESDSEDSQVYIKKPPNAFMLFMKEQRPNVSKELWRKGSGVVNSYLAAIVGSISFFFSYKCP